ncbi:PREDICTED: E3 ubiquitin-protein ligase SINA-like 5 [Camelina sativa]|uniref:RING-type E3 ubiquitin transferase n=1 Tax=Camelina sativa TaxID=90675 RepID=A0ABM0WPF8_CAMSA|nr:PREDICTED: E3 ubiquitin-protein ligase SINA-like 5 [Camelina sativa]
MAITGEDNGDRSGDERLPKRQRLPSEDEDDDDDFESVKLQSHDVLDGPICCEPLKRPIYQCINGHLACSSCCQKLNKRCSFCRCEIGDIRCRAMEKVIEATIVPCPNAKHGCEETTTYGIDQSVHERVCCFAPCSCPVPSCKFVGTYTNLKSHACHAHICREKFLIPFKFNGHCPIFRMNLGNKKTVILKEENENDLIAVQAFKGSDEGVYVTVNRIVHMGPGIRDVFCKFLCRTPLRETMVKKIQKVREQMHPEDDDVIWIPLPPEMLLRGASWMMAICIDYDSWN